MKSISLLASLTALSALCVAFGCSDKSDGNNGTAGSTSVAGRTSTGGGDAEAGDTGENGGKTSSGGRTSSGGASSNAGEAGDNSAVAGDTSAGGDKGSADGTITSCGEGVVIEGDPLYDDDAMPATDGQGVFADPPVRNQAIAVIGNDFYVETDQEIWRVDLSVAAAKRKLTRVAGVELDSGGFVNAGVACADTTFLSIRDMAATADGKLVVVDYVANSVIEITNPGTATCKSAWVAGTHVKSPDPGANFPVTYGDVDGPGASALFGGGKGAGIQKVAVDPDGNIYTFDNGTGKFKQIATDADRTVSTIGQGLADDTINGLTFLNGKLYAVGVDGTNDLLLEIDPAKYKVATPKANVKEIYRVRDHFDDVPTGHQAITTQVVNDGEALIISGQAGYVWRVGTDGTVLATLAGTGTHLEFSTNFDPTVAHAAKDWELYNSISNSKGGPWLALSDGKLYWSGGEGASNPAQYTIQFSCQ